MSPGKRNIFQQRTMNLARNNRLSPTTSTFALCFFFSRPRRIYPSNGCFLSLTSGKWRVVFLSLPLVFICLLRRLWPLRRSPSLFYVCTYKPTYIVVVFIQIYISKALVRSIYSIANGRKKNDQAALL